MVDVQHTETSVRSTARIHRRLARALLVSVNRTLTKLERDGEASAALDRHPPVFIIGAPRSGSTVLMQLFVRYFDVTYLTNLHRYFYGDPAMASVLAARLPSSSDLTSDYGGTRQLMGPWEGAEWWYRFFPGSPHYGWGEPGYQVRLAALRKSVEHWTRSAGQSVVFKNNFAAYRLHYLARALPEARYLHIVRDERDNAHSLLVGRMAQNGDYASWFSMQPPGWNAVDREDPVSQVLFQVRETNRIIRNDVVDSGIGASSVLEVRYEALCQDTPGQMERISEFLETGGINRRETPRVPANLQRSETINIPPAMFSRLRALTQGSESTRT